MSAHTWKNLIAWTLTAAACVNIGGAGYAAEQGTQGAAMPGMDMPAPPSSVHDRGAEGRLPEGYAEVRIVPDVQQRIGVTLGRVERSSLSMTIRAVGIVQPNETKVAHIHVKTEGWVEKLYVSYTGQKVKAGDPLLSIYSPTFFAAQREFLSAMRAAQTGAVQLGDAQLADSQALVDTARRRLELWDIPKDEIDALQKSGEPRRTLTLRSPISGTVLEKQAFAGQYVMPQSDLYVVADLSSIWMQARVFQYELPHVAVGMPVEVSVASVAAQPLAGKVVFIDPIVDEMSRSAQVRIELPNPTGQLRPGMYGDVLIAHAMGTGLTVPVSAVIRTGERDIAFRAVSTDRFVPVEVKVSPTTFADRFQVVQGLSAGDQVVTSANFLIDSESRLEAGAGSMAGMPGMGGGADSSAEADRTQHSAHR
jgi:Cu(I)/Ag(I) efflux system membrane fusion protein